MQTRRVIVCALSIICKLVGISINYRSKQHLFTFPQTTQGLNLISNLKKKNILKNCHLKFQRCQYKLFDTFTGCHKSTRYRKGARPSAKAANCLCHIHEGFFDSLCFPETNFRVKIFFVTDTFSY